MDKPERPGRSRRVSEARAIEAARALARGDSAAAVAERYGISVPSLYAALRRYRIPTPKQLTASLLRANRHRRSCPLTEAQAVTAARFLARGEPVATTAARFGLSKDTLYKALRRYEIPTPKQLAPALQSDRLRRARAAARHRGVKFGSSPKLNQSQAAEAARQIAQGESLAAAAARLGVRPMTLRAALRRHGLKPPSRNLTQAQAAKAVQLLAEGKSLQITAKSFGVWPITLLNTLRRYGLAPSANRQAGISSKNKKKPTAGSRP